MIRHSIDFDMVSEPSLLQLYNFIYAVLYFLYYV